MPLLAGAGTSAPSTQKPVLIAALGVMLAYNSLDLVVWRLVMQDVKVDLRLSDTQLGLLTGFAYSLFYAVMGLPIARWADRGFRAAIISVSAALSGLMVALIGAAQSFTQVLLIRAGVAVGDAGCTPPSQSLIADHFTRSERPRATALVLLGAPLSGILGSPLAGWLNEVHGWRLTFVFIGVPGLLLGLISWWILRGYERAPDSAKAEEKTPSARTAYPPKQSYHEALSALASVRTFRWVLLGYFAIAFFGSGIAKWEAVFFRRTHSLETGELGLWLGFVSLVGLVGTYAGGHLASRYAPNNEGLQLKVIGVSFATMSLLAVLVYVMPDYRIAFAVKALKVAGACLVAAPILALLQTLVRDDLRASASAVFLLFNHLVGGGLGPVAIGGLSDALQPLLGNESLRYALIVSCPGYLFGGWCLWRASRSVMADIARASATGAKNFAATV